MPKCLTHKKVKERFIADLSALCEKHNIKISSAEKIYVSIEPRYNSASGLYEEYGADFDIGHVFPFIITEDIEPKMILNSDFPVHQRG